MKEPNKKFYLLNDKFKFLYRCIAKIFIIMFFLLTDSGRIDSGVYVKRQVVIPDITQDGDINISNIITLINIIAI